MSYDYDSLRSNMVERQLVPRGIRAPAVLDAMRNVPRHLFVPENMQKHAYDDSPMPIGLGQTISQPYIVAYMTEQLEPFTDMKVLEIGTGSGYQAAVLAYLGCKVFTIELLEEHAERARKVLRSCSLESVSVKHGNGFLGWPEHAPFDAIIVTAAPDSVPSVLISQLKDKGKMIIPVGSVYEVQSLKSIVRNGENIITKDLLHVRFVPMVNG